jgi:hypothetical protein
MTSRTNQQRPVKNVKLGVVLVAMLITSAAASAASIKSAICKFTLGTDNLEITFDQLDNAQSRGRMIGNNGTNDVMVIPAPDTALHVIEFTAAGYITLTTLRLTPTTKHLDTVEAIHSRHTGVNTKLLPSQWLGQCTVFTM